MMFRHRLPLQGFSGAAFAAILLFCPLAAAQAGSNTAVVPERTIYPGEELHEELVREVVVTNPNLRAGYAAVTSEVVGMVTTRTLLPGRTIPVGALREAWTVVRGKSVPLVFNRGGLTITAVGTPLENASIGDFIRVRNIETGVIISGTVMDDGRIQVAAK
ncbi:flagellar basal body P-ring formation chaperone FlgA [Hoeflea sp. YIM 152468]|uniref:flagellar basal body P-ring formation chaperone FlgA n=1 Tax=Hoeflea sp. YIM 152468 TaxID=3031759 RepID=UPI0023DB0DA4|nr:flagellar basal body P-ring formation chaperone FlgA [Hoeflea sp. YIM 152468]MDF1608857.1 flagellar basal body P-ring formation chaperone FlgA [Hoeflea sp. YIM 152468]